MDLNLETKELRMSAIIAADDDGFQPHFTNDLECRVHKSGNVGSVAFKVKYSTELHDRDIDVTIDILDIMRIIEAYYDSDDCADCRL